MPPRRKRLELESQPQPSQPPPQPQFATPQFVKFIKRNIKKSKKQHDFNEDAASIKYLESEKKIPEFFEKEIERELVAEFNELQHLSRPGFSFDGSKEGTIKLLTSFTKEEVNLLFSVVSPGVSSSSKNWKKGPVPSN